MSTYQYCPACLGLFRPEDLKDYGFSFMHGQSPVFLYVCPLGCTGSNRPVEGEAYEYTKDPAYRDQHRIILLDPIACEVQTPEMILAEDEAIARLESLIDAINRIAPQVDCNSFTRRSIKLDLSDVIESFY